MPNNNNVSNYRKAAAKAEKARVKMVAKLHKEIADRQTILDTLEVKQVPIAPAVVLYKPASAYRNAKDAILNAISLLTEKAKRAPCFAELFSALTMAPSFGGRAKRWTEGYIRCTLSALKQAGKIISPGWGQYQIV